MLPMLREMGCSYFSEDGFKNLGFYDEKAQELISYPRFMFELSALIVMHSFAQEAYYNHRVASYSLMETHVKRALTNLLNSSDFETVTNIDVSVQCSQTGVLIETNLENRLLSISFWDFTLTLKGPSPLMVSPFKTYAFLACVLFLVS